MRTRRPDAPRVPGFPDPRTDATAKQAPVARPGEPLDPTAGTRQLNVRVLAPLLGRYKRMLRELDDNGFDTTLTELVHALLHQGPSDAEEARRLIRAWRRALDPPD